MALLTDAPALSHESLEAFWMPFTANRQFKAAPRMLVEAEDVTTFLSQVAELISLRATRRSERTLRMSAANN